MSKSKVERRNGVKLPLAIQDRLGVQLDTGRVRGSQKSRQNGVSERKARRHAERRALPVLKEPIRRKDSVLKSEQNSVEKTSRVESRNTSTSTNPHRSHHQRSKVQVKPAVVEERRRVRSNSVPLSSNSSVASSRESSPGLVLDASSKSFRDRSAQDDAEIAALEKRLGVRGKRSAPPEDDMLDYLLGGIDAAESAQNLRPSGREWLRNKRRKFEDTQFNNGSSSQDELPVDIDGSGESEGEVSQVLDGTSDSELGTDEDNTDVESHTDLSDAYSGYGSAEEDSFEGFGPDGEEEVSDQTMQKTRENPYVAPVPAGTTVTKYVPPSLRQRSAVDQQSLDQLRRQVQGQINRLSEANLITILGEIEKFYRTNARQDVTTVLIDILLSLFCNRSALQNTFIILHAAFVAAVYKVIGIDFGAEMLARLVETFDKQYKAADGGKQALNILSLLANLFTFNATSSNIVYDYIQLLLSDFSEGNAEMLLRIVRDCGPQLRSDDPTALKGIVHTVNTIASEMATKGQQLNVRTKVMMDTITDLRNNKVRDASNAAGHAGEHITRMRKVLGTLNSRNLKAAEPLRLTKHDIENSTKTGKWWLVGASWRGAGDAQQQVTNNATDILESDALLLADEAIDYFALAKQFNMNTDVRRSIFVAIMSADDIQDAQMRLLKLRLTNKQEQEIAKVVLRCARAEPVYNPYYALLAKHLCKENKRIRMSFQFGLWAFFDAIGEKADNDESDVEDDMENVELAEVVNIAKMFAYMIFHGHFSLGILKTLNIGMLREQATLFLEILLISIMTQPGANDNALMKIFTGAVDTPQIVKSLQYFMKKQVQKSDLVSKGDRHKVKKGCMVANLAFNIITSNQVDPD